jgi:quercetin dioxygenase-like cupin family protein
MLKNKLLYYVGKEVPMKRSPIMIILVLAIGIALGMIGSQLINAQQPPPTKAKGTTAKTVASLELGPQIPELQGRYLRGRVVTFEPGGYAAVHSHKERPGFVYVLQGTFSDCTPDGKCVELHEGQAGTESKDLVHWPENRGTNPLIILAVDISKEP